LISLEHSFWPTAFRGTLKSGQERGLPWPLFFSFAPRRTRPAGRRLQAQRFGVCLEKRPDPLRAGLKVTGGKKETAFGGRSRSRLNDRDCEMRLTAPGAIQPRGGKIALRQPAQKPGLAQILNWNDGN